MSNSIKTQIKDPELIKKRHFHIAQRASQLFIKQGYSATTIREISKATGITIGNLYDYIEKKEDVLCLVFNVFHQMWIEYLEKHGVFEIEDPVEQLRTATRRMLEPVYDYHEMVLLMYQESKHLPKKFLQETMKKEGSLIDCFEKILIRGVEKKAFHVDDTFFTANMIVFQLAIPSLRWWSLKKKFTTEQLMDLIESAVMKSVQ